MSTLTIPADADAPTFDLSPPGERYFRHPGDVVRLVVWGSVTLALGILLGTGTSTADGVTDDLSRLSGRAADSARELLLVLTQMAALAGPVAVFAALAVKRRFRRIGLLAPRRGRGRPVLAPARSRGSISRADWPMP